MPRRFRAIARCLYHALELPFVETWRTGEAPHYRPWSWRRHAVVNLGEAFRLAFFLPVDAEFHGLAEASR